MRQSVNTIIQDKAEKYLLQMRDGTKGICNPFKWNFFGGSINDGENPMVAAVREAKEELGIDAKPGQFTLLGELQSKKNRLIHIVRYEQSVEWKDITPQKGAGAGYFTRDELQKIDITDATRTLIKNYLP